MTARFSQLCRNLAARRGAGVFVPSFHLGGRSYLTYVPRVSNLISKTQQQQWRSGRRDWWCSVAPASQEAELPRSTKSLPWLMLPPEEIPGEDEEEEGGGSGIHKKTVNLKFVNPTRKKVKLEKRKVPEAVVNGHCAGSSGNWLFYLNYDDYGPVGIYMVNLFPSPSAEAACAETIALPSVFTLPRLVSFTAKARDKAPPEAVSPSTDYEILSYNFQAPPGGGFCSTDYKILSYNFRNDYGDLSSSPPETMAAIGIRKVAMSTSSSLTMVIICGPESRLAFCKPGESTSWTPLESPTAMEGEGYFDVIYSGEKKLFLALTRHRCIEAWDLPDNPFSPKEKIYLDSDSRRIYSEEMYKCHFKKLGSSEYLVESCDGSILHVVRYHKRYISHPPGDEKEIKPEKTATFRFNIYKLDLKKRKGAEVPGLGEEALFLGSNQSFALAVSDYPASKLKPNSIYFSDDDDPIHGHANVGGDMGIFNLKSERVSSPYSTDSKRIIPRPLWVVPPPWLVKVLSREKQRPEMKSPTVGTAHVPVATEPKILEP